MAASSPKKVGMGQQRAANTAEGAFSNCIGLLKAGRQHDWVQKEQISEKKRWAEVH